VAVGARDKLGRGKRARGLEMALLLDRQQDESLEVGVAHDPVVPGGGKARDLAGAVEIDRDNAALYRAVVVSPLEAAAPWSLPTTCISFEPLP
jgi:hypothetical protein